MTFLEILIDWVFFPLLDMLSRWHISGKWHLSYLFPIATALGVLLCWLGYHYDIIVLLVFGMLTTVLFGLSSILTFIPREVGFWEDMKYRRSGNVEKAKDENKEA